MIWAFVVILALLVPIPAIVLDSGDGQALAVHVSEDGSAGELEEREETEFVRSLMEGRDDEEPIRLDAGD